MIYFFKPLPPGDIDFNKYMPFIKNEWFRRHFMKFVYALQLMIIALSIVFGVWNYSNWFIRTVLFIGVFICHELLHILVVCKIGDISLTHSGIFFWLNSNAIMSKRRFWLFMTLPLLVFTLIPMIFLWLLEGYIFDMMLYVVWINAIIAGSDIINSVLIAFKPSHAKFYRGYYTIEND